MHIVNSCILCCVQPAINPGECWAFTGSRGYMVIELSENVTVTAFTMEHLPRSLSPSGTIDTAPKDFRVLVSYLLLNIQEGGGC